MVARDVVSRLRWLDVVAGAVMPEVVAGCGDAEPAVVLTAVPAAMTAG